MKVTLEIEISEESLELGKKLINAEFDAKKNDVTDNVRNIAAMFVAICEDNKSKNSLLMQANIEAAWFAAKPKF